MYFHIGSGRASCPQDAARRVEDNAPYHAAAPYHIHVDFPIADSPLEIWKHLAVKLAFNCLSTGTMAAMGRIAGKLCSGEAR